MNTITTQPFALKQIDYFKISVTIFLKKRWWIFIWIWALALYDIFGNPDGVGFLTYFGILYPVLLAYRLWKSAGGPENRNYFTPRQLEISETGIYDILTGSKKEIIDPQSIIKAVEIKNYYLIYFSKAIYIPIPKTAFLNQSDAEKFHRMYMPYFTHA